MVWYWGFGYIGNINLHHHIKKLLDYGIDGFKKYYDNILISKEDLWTFIELFTTFYNLNLTAEVLGRGGSHISSNPCKGVVTNKKEVDRINKVVIPQIIEQIYIILERNEENISLFNQLVMIDSEGDSNKTLEFILSTHFTPSDLPLLNRHSDVKVKLSEDDMYRIHKLYYTHINKNK